MQIIHASWRVDAARPNTILLFFPSWLTFKLTILVRSLSDFEWSIDAGRKGSWG